MKLYIAFLLVAVVAAQSHSRHSGGQGRHQGPTSSTGQGRQQGSTFSGGQGRQQGSTFSGGPGRSVGSSGGRGPPAANQVNPFKAVPFHQSQGLSNFIPLGFRSGNTNPYGAKVYGMGINNRWAQPHNVFEVNRALQVANNNPNLLVRINPDGDVELTDRYGMEAEDLYNAWGQDITDF